MNEDIVEILDELVATQEWGAKAVHDRDEAWRAIQLVRDLHTPHEDRECGTVCAECSYFGGDYGLDGVDYPCDTLRALDGDA